MRREIQPHPRDSWVTYWERFVRADQQERDGMAPTSYVSGHRRRRGSGPRKALISIIVVGPRYLAAIDQALAERLERQTLYASDLDLTRHRVKRQLEDAIRRATPDELVIADRLMGIDAVPRGWEGR